MKGAFEKNMKFFSIFEKKVPGKIFGSERHKSMNLGPSRNVHEREFAPERRKIVKVRLASVRLLRGQMSEFSGK